MSPSPRPGGSLMHFLLRNGFFSALGSVISFRMKNDESGLDLQLVQPEPLAQ
jgi:hypothetical protein